MEGLTEKNESMKRKISGKFYGFIFSFLIGLVMSLAMSFFALVFYTGFIEGFFVMWMKRVAIGMVIGFPIAAVTVPLIQRFLDRHFIIKDNTK